MAEQQPIKPPQELVEQLRSEAPNGIHDLGATRELYLIHNAYRAGADQALEACCEWLDKGPYGFSIAASASELTRSLRAALRPKPKGLKEQGRKALERISNSVVMATGGAELDVLKAIVESLPDQSP